MNKQLQAARDKRRLAILCWIAAAAILSATLWPFNPFPPNRVRWLGDSDGIAFDGAGLVIGKAPLVAVESTLSQSCSLEILLRPAAVTSVYTILDFYTPNNPEQFLVRQWTDGLLVSHDIVDANGKVKRKKFDVDHAFQPGKLLLVTIVSGPNGTTVYNNGRLALVLPRFIISPSELSGQIVLGASSVHYEPWAGEVRGLAIYSTGLTAEQVWNHYERWMNSSEPTPATPPDLTEAVAFYSFNERAGQEIHNAAAAAPDFEIPKHFSVPHKAMLASPKKEFEANWHYVKDVVFNVAGFVPLGVIFCVYFSLARSRREAILCATLAAGTLSLIIEVLQAYIPQRVSDTTDVITNTLGAAIGALLARPNAIRRFLGR
ncbi:MAG: VanZ family protein [Candidatus Sulfotelmatobacter sp.]